MAMYCYDCGKIIEEDTDSYCIKCFETLLDGFKERMLAFLEAEEIDEWFARPNSLFDGLSPKQCLMRGRGKGTIEHMIALQFDN